MNVNVVFLEIFIEISELYNYVNESEIEVLHDVSVIQKRGASIFFAQSAMFSSQIINTMYPYIYMYICVLTYQGYKVINVSIKH